MATEALRGLLIALGSGRRRALRPFSRGDRLERSRNEWDDELAHTRTHVLP